MNISRADNSDPRTFQWIGDDLIKFYQTGISAEEFIIYCEVVYL